ncbi:MAG: hypothetical protein WBF37_06150, partial [Dehalococcoidia bacterium]
MNLNDVDLFGGISGIEIEPDIHEFGHGISIAKTYAHVMAPYLAAFARAEPGKPHPAPWKAVSGGLSYDVL